MKNQLMTFEVMPINLPTNKIINYYIQKVHFRNKNINGKILEKCTLKKKNQLLHAKG